MPAHEPSVRAGAEPTRIMRWLTEAKYFASLTVSGQRRHAVPWLRSLSRGYLLDAPSPWITFGAIEALRGYVKDGMRIFEYGSGGSTLFWLGWAVDLCTVEHDAAWHEVVRRRIPGDARVDLKLREPEPFDARCVGLDPFDPDTYASSDEAFRGRTFRAYVTEIDRFPDESLDVVLVDGRARPACLKHAAPKVKRGGLLVLDNADREGYVSGVGGALARFRPERYAGPGPVNPVPWRTDIFVRS